MLFDGIGAHPVSLEVPVTTVAASPPPGAGRLARVGRGWADRATEDVRLVDPAVALLVRRPGEVGVTVALDPVKPAGESGEVALDAELSRATIRPPAVVIGAVRVMSVLRPSDPIDPIELIEAITASPSVSG